MKRYVFVLLFMIFNLTAIKVQAQPQIKSIDLSKKYGLKIVVTSIQIDNEALKLVYEIRNDSEEDVWILADICSLDWLINRLDMGADVFMDEDDQTLVVRGRFGLPLTFYGHAIHGRYVRLCPGEKQTESILLKIPVYPSCITIHPKRTKRQEQGLEYARRLVIELGYYTGDLPERIIKTLPLPENIFPPKRPFPSSSDSYLRWRERYLSLPPNAFSSINERLISREEEALIPELNAFPEFTRKESEQVSRTVVENLRIPYREKEYRSLGNELPDFTSCKKIEVRYQPSMLEYFFPYAFLQSLLSLEEKEYLKSEHTIIFEDFQDIKAISRDICKGEFLNSVVNVRYRSYLDMICYYDDKPPLSFPIYNDDTIVYKGESLFLEDSIPTLKKLTPQIHGIELRIQCAANLKNQWYRFRFHNMLEALRQSDLSRRNKKAYPIPYKWCDVMLRPYPARGGTAEGKWSKRYHVCPGAGKGKNHYAMNLNCKPDSPADMVLLFETKAGWNQHGGPELFTFDNHDPKGGCVLLNDGTVKFIRTKEELHQLRWEEKRRDETSKVLKRRDEVSRIMRNHYPIKDYGFEIEGPFTIEQCKEHYVKHELEWCEINEEKPGKLKYLLDKIKRFPESQKFKDFVRPVANHKGNELYFFTSDLRSWSDWNGIKGYVIVYKNEIVDIFGTGIN